MDCPCGQCDFKWSFTQDRWVVCNDSCNAFCCSACEVINSAECWTVLKTHLWCFDQINFTNGVGMPLVMNVWNDLWLPTLLIEYCFAVLRMRGPRSDMLAHLLSCRFFLHSTEYRDTAGNLNDNLHSSIRAVLRSNV